MSQRHDFIKREPLEPWHAEFQFVLVVSNADYKNTDHHDDNDKKNYDSVQCLFSSTKNLERTISYGRFLLSKGSPCSKYKKPHHGGACCFGQNYVEGVKFGAPEQLSPFERMVPSAKRSRIAFSTVLSLPHWNPPAPIVRNAQVAAPLPILQTEFS